MGGAVDPFGALGDQPPGDPSAAARRRSAGAGHRRALPISRRQSPAPARPQDRRPGQRAGEGTAGCMSCASRVWTPCATTWSACGRGDDPLPAARREHLEGRAGDERRAKSECHERTVGDVLRRRVLGRPRIRDLDSTHRHLVAERPHRQRRQRGAGRARTGVGGRIFERAPDGREHDWGRSCVGTADDLAYLWHLGGAPSRHARRDRFHVLGAHTTASRSSTPAGSARRTAGETWRERNQVGWATLLPHFRTSIERENA